MTFRISASLRNELIVLEADTYDSSNPEHIAKGAFVQALRQAQRHDRGHYLLTLDGLARSYAVGRTGAFENSIDIWKDAPNQERRGWIRSSEAILTKLRQT